MDRVRERLTQLKALLAGILSARDAADRRRETLTGEEEARFKEACAQLKRDLDAALQRVETETGEERGRIEAKRKRQAAMIGAAFSRMKAMVEERSRQRLASFRKRQRDAHEEAERLREEKAIALREGSSAVTSRLASFEATAAGLKEGVARFAEEHGIRLEGNGPKTAIDAVPADFDRAADEIAKRLADIGEFLDSSRRRMKKRTRSLLPYAIVFLVHAGVYVYYCSENWLSFNAALIGGSLAIVLSIVQSAYHAAKVRRWSAATVLNRDVSAVCALIERQKHLAAVGIDDGIVELEGERSVRTGAADQEFETASLDAKKTAAEESQALRSRNEELAGRVARRKSADLEALDRESQEKSEGLRARYEKDLALERERHAAGQREIEEEKKNAIDRLASEWSGAIAGFRAFGEEAMRWRCEAYPPWRDREEQSVKLPAAFSAEVCIGDARADMRGLDLGGDPDGRFSIPAGPAPALPLSLSFPDFGCLFVSAGPEKRSEAVQMVFGASLRLLSAFPPGKAKLTILDPVGLGQNFAALMHLSDYDESLVGGRIWTESAHIERRLSELTEHMEKVIQKYLRNRYASINEYNAEAGQMAEPYRFLVIADFPTGFSELALDKLAGIVTSGARCGVYTFILHDQKQKLPGTVAETHLRQNGVFILGEGDGFVLDDPVLKRAKFVQEESPAPAVVDSLLLTVGTQARDAERVEVSFESAAPKAAEIWRDSSESGFRLPLGKAGADRLQFLELGRGTAQHALIAGKTGSGKSTLFHVVITNAALWYGPRELEFYLIDFKKGVEFKTYAVNGLPHARVIAIESDREFGLSVLRRVDKELTRRGELFREARVQDLASYRKSAPGEAVPRTLLIIDEFQEFFTQDDGVAQNAALLLDRIVRQGRAFGIHVILGSQTLGGAYTLAKSTLGQMGVRIALQCNEADSYLILSDDNAAARLLSRPGEAIYNDMSGAIEGNNPFQIVWLPKETQDRYLGSLRKKAEADRLPAMPATVFEGNAPADLRNNSVLMGLALGRHKPGDASSRAWLGEANAIKGPTEVEFERHAGSNLLIVGQQGDAALASCCAAIVSLAAGTPPDAVRFRVLDGSAPDSGARERLEALVRAFPHDMEIIDSRRTPQAIEELAAVVKSRQEGADASGARFYLMVLGLQRFRMLRQDDEYAVSADGSPAGHFTNLINDGPGEGLHSIVWCDTLANLNRTFGRKTLREFDARVLFQMSATDSSELIDSPAANTLGLYSALLFTTAVGAVEKFRPYAAPDSGLVEELGRALRAKYQSPAASPASRALEGRAGGDAQ